MRMNGGEEEKERRRGKGGGELDHSNDFYAAVV